MTVGVRDLLPMFTVTNTVDGALAERPISRRRPNSPKYLPMSSISCRHADASMDNSCFSVSASTLSPAASKSWVCGK